MVMICLTLFTKLKSQTLQVTANFVQPDIPVTIHPENPAYCNPNVGVEVMVVENFNSYLWIAPTIPGQTTSSPPLTGKNAVLKKSGEWRLRVEYEVNGVVCIKEIKFYVGDLSNSNGIEAYFENAGFYSVSIFRENPTLVSVPECNPDPVTFVSGENYIDLNEAIQNVYNNFKPISEVTPSSIVLSENNCLCNVGIDMLENQFNEGSLSVWGHQFFKNSSDLDGKLFVKARMPGEERLPIQTQKEHLQEIHPTILSSNIGSQEHGRVVFSNLFMPHPIGGYEPEGMCEIPNDLIPNTHFMTPANIAVLPIQGATNYFFTTDKTIEQINNGSILKFDVNNKTFQGFIRFDNEIIFNGFFNEISAEFYEDFTSQYIQVACRSECLINICTVGSACHSDDCTFTTSEYKFNTDEIPVQSVQDGGFDWPISSLQKEKIFEDFPISQFDSKRFVYDLLCAMKNGASSIAYDPTMNGKIIFAKDVYLGKTYFPAIGMVMPNQGNEILLHSNFNFISGGTNKMFENALEVSPTNNQIRLVFFDSNSKKKARTIKSSYEKNHWNLNGYRLFIECVVNKGNIIQSYLKPKSDNLLIFVNGYRDNGPTNLNSEYNPSNNEVSPCNDFYEGGTYWNETGRLFVAKINTENIIYADGHHSITTSNHFIAGDNPRVSKIHFATGMANCLGEAGIRIPSYLSGYSSSPFNCFLDVVPNTNGFIVRYANGFIAGQNLWSKIQSGKVKIKMNESKTMIKGKIDIVAHSMGFAYALGMTEFLKTKILPDANGYYFGRFYILTPENGCSAPPFNLSDFEEVWQYGSNEDVDIDYRQDGVAPQCAVTGIDWEPQTNNQNIPAYGRIPFQGKNEHRNFLEAHYGENYDWVTRLRIDVSGAVKRRY